MVNANVKSVNFSEAFTQVLTAVEADQPIMLIGDPGIGKSALGTLVAKEIDLPLEILIGSTLDSTDIGGLPTVNPDRGVERFPLRSIRNACERPTLLFLDELSCSPWPVQAAMLRLVFERWAGDQKLHPGTRIILATNPEEQSPGGVPISAPMVGRVQLFRLRPQAGEVLTHFNTLKGDKFLRDEVRDFVDITNLMPDLLQIDCPAEAVGGNVPWGSPRSWERSIRLRAALGRRDQDSKAKRVATAGAVGDILASSYAAIIEIREKLPSVQEILSNPMASKIPEERTYQVGAASLLPRVADENTWAAWVYTSRLSQEMQSISTHILMKRQDSSDDAPHCLKGKKARTEVLRGIGRGGAKNV